MSKSKKKAIIGLCKATNTEFYREANKKLRKIKKHILSLFYKGEINEDTIQFPNKHKDIGYTDWTEPTDGKLKIEYSSLWSKEEKDKYRRK